MSKQDDDTRPLPLPGTRVLAGIDLAKGSDFTAVQTVARGPLAQLGNLLNEVGAKVTFSRWCRSGLVGEESCICRRCQRRRFGKDLVWHDMNEKAAEMVALLLDKAWESGRAWAETTRKIAEIFKDHESINHPAYLVNSPAERTCKFGCQGYDRGNPFDPEDKESWMCVWPDCETTGGVVAINLSDLVFGPHDPGDEHHE